MASHNKHIIVGTAGHVDHGKTELIGALSGIKTDRLKEEQQRGISIDLGFAAFKLDNGEQIGVIDVPGHEKFISNMLAGIGGIDMVLLVVDANEGVMPQTVEHLQILDLLNIPRGIIVMTKIDLVEQDWADIVEEEIREAVQGTFLAEAPVARVSSITGTGINDLTTMIEAQAAQIPERDADGPMRLPIDRHFSVAGFGTVVTGTLLTGTASIGDNVEILPLGEQVRIRDIQVHNKKCTEARCGQRVALNLAGLQRENLHRGCVVATPGIFEQTSRIDARLTLLEDAPRPLKFRDPVHLYLGTSRVVGVVALLDRDQLEAGESALVQVHLDKPLVAHREDRFIIRSYSPMHTIGGGSVIDPGAEKHKRFRSEVQEALKELESGEGSFILQKLSELQCARVKDLEQISALSRERITANLEQLQNSAQAIALGDQWVDASSMKLWLHRIKEAVAAHHTTNPLLPGMGHAPLKALLPKRLSNKAFEELLLRAELERVGEWIKETQFTPRPDAAQEQIIDAICSAYKRAGVQVKGRTEMLGRIDFGAENPEDLLGYIFFSAKLIKLTDDIFIHPDAYTQALNALIQHFSKHSSLTLAEYRDLIGSARKPVQALLEYFDAQKYTLRKGDAREAWKLPKPD
ncbi:MAG: selenocysteine-specific translation elongation factor [Geobacteraceae bacterium]|nr:selenocysteine-specific translation elongation factor [Geobacteraceae bacterium]